MSDMTILWIKKPRKSGRSMPKKLVPALNQKFRDEYKRAEQLEIQNLEEKMGGDKRMGSIYKVKRERPPKEIKVAEEVKPPTGMVEELETPKVEAMDSIKLPKEMIEELETPNVKVADSMKSPTVGEAIDSKTKLAVHLGGQDISVETCDQELLSDNSKAGSADENEFMEKIDVGNEEKILKESAEESLNANDQLTISDSVEEAAVEEIAEVDKQKTFAFYRNRPIRKRKINQLIRNVNDGVKFESEYLKKAAEMVKYLGDGFSLKMSDEVMRDFLMECPQVLELSPEEIEERYNAIEDCLMFDKKKHTSFLLEWPQMLGLSKVEIQLKMIILEKLPVNPRLSYDRVVYIVRKHPPLLLSKMDSQVVYTERINNLLNLRFNQEQAYELLMKYPQILLCHPKTVEEKVTFYMRDMNGVLRTLVAFPRFFQVSMERLKERYAYLLSENRLNMRSRVNEDKLRAIVLTTDEVFCERATETTKKHYREFQEEYRRQQVEPHVYDRRYRM